MGYLELSEVAHAAETALSAPPADPARPLEPDCAAVLEAITAMQHLAQGDRLPPERATALVARLTGARRGARRPAPGPARLRRRARAGGARPARPGRARARGPPRLRPPRARRLRPPHPRARRGDEAGAADAPRRPRPRLAPPRARERPAAGAPGGADDRRRRAHSRAELLAIGASTGGPPVLEILLKALPPVLPVPIAVVQHMTAGFNRDFAQWLGETTGRRAVLVAEPVALEPGVVYLAADDRHLVFASRGEAAPSASSERRFQRPSVDILFESAAATFGGRVAAVLLTGMGADGVDGLAQLREQGAFTLAQSLQSCVVDAMPRGAIERGLVDVVADPDGLAAALAQHLG